MARAKTPEERSELIEKRQKKAKRSYKANTKKRTKLSPSELEFVTDMALPLKLVGYTHSQMGMILNVSRGQIGEIVKDTKFQKRLNELKTKLPQAALSLMQAYTVEAVQAVVDVLRTSKKDEMVLKAAAEIFDRAGLPKLSRTESKAETPPMSASIAGGQDWMQQLSEQPEEIQEKAAELFDMFQDGLKLLISEGKDKRETPK